MLVDFVVQPYFKRIFVLSEVHKQSDISTILASSAWDKIKRAAQAQNLRSSESFIAFLSFSERILLAPPHSVRSIYSPRFCPHSSIVIDTKNSNGLFLYVSNQTRLRLTTISNPNHLSYTSVPILSLVQNSEHKN